MAACVQACVHACVCSRGEVVRYIDGSEDAEYGQHSDIKDSALVTNETL